MDDLDESSDEEDMTGDENEAERRTRTEVVTQDELGRSTIFLRLIRDMEEQWDSIIDFCSEGIYQLWNK